MSRIFHQPSPFRLSSLVFFIAWTAGPNLLPAGIIPTNESKTVSNAGKNGALLGYSIAIDGNVAVAGAPTSSGINNVDSPPFEGTADVFLRDGNEWKFAARLVPATGDKNQSAGFSVAISGDVIVLGLPFSKETGMNDAGVAWVFVKPAGGWSGVLVPSCRLTASDFAEEDQLGFSVAIDGDVVVAGAPGDDRLESAVGAAYVFVKPAGGWAGNINESAKLTLADANENDAFGMSLGMDGDVIVGGAPNADLHFTDQGSAYVFVKPAGGWAGVLTESAQLGASDGGELDRLAAVAISGNTIVAGSPGTLAEDGATGAAYVFERPAGGWSGDITETGKIVPDTADVAFPIGWPVVIHDDVIALGHHLLFVRSSEETRNYAFVVQKPAGGWPPLIKARSFKATDSQSQDYFGQSVALSGKTLLVGAMAVSTAFNMNVGAFYAYELKPDSDDDGVPDDADQCPGAPDVDTDDDGLLDCKDNCPETANADQADADGDGVGDACIPPPAGDPCCGGGTMAMMTPLVLLLLSRKSARRPRRE